MPLITQLAGTTTGTTSDGDLTTQQLLLLVGGVVAAVLLVGAVGSLLDSHFRSSRAKNSDGRYTGTRRIDVTFARVVSLLTVAAMGAVGLAMSTIVESDLVAAYFTLLGTIAGYLIGAKTSTTSTTEQTVDDTGQVVSTEVQTPTLG